ncbi:MAG: hypothetical protein AAGF60_08460 [Pseudomonadota bacterium]
MIFGLSAIVLIVGTSLGLGLGRAGLWGTLGLAVLGILGAGLIAGVMIGPGAGFNQRMGLLFAYVAIGIFVLGAGIGALIARVGR